MIKFVISCKNESFGRLALATVSFSILKDFSAEIIGGINNCYFLIVFGKMCQHIESVCNSVNQYFPNDQCLIIKVYDRLLGFNAAEYRKFIDMIFCLFIYL